MTHNELQMMKALDAFSHYNIEPTAFQVKSESGFESIVTAEMVCQWALRYINSTNEKLENLAGRINVLENRLKRITEFAHTRP